MSRAANEMASEILLNIKEEVTCPICLDLLTEPLTLVCGHSFCQACITANDTKSVNKQEKESSCPVCRVSYRPGSLQPNRHLANIVEKLREVKVSPEEGQNKHLCTRHGEKLLLFCKKDGKVICWLCERSQEHRGHHTFLVEEVAQEYKKNLWEVLKTLRKKEQEAEKLEGDIKKERTSWKNQIQHERQRVQNSIKQLKAILDSEEQKELQKLENEEGYILRSLAESENELVQQSQLVRDVISDLEHRLQGSAVELLQDVNGIMKRSKTLTLKKPDTLSQNQRTVFKAADLIKVLQRFEELTEVRRYWVDFKLNPVSAVSNIVVSEDQRQVRPAYPFKSSNMQPHDIFTLDVLGCQYFSSGKYYWEVDVSEKNAWILGVYSKNVSKEKLKFNESSPFLGRRYRPDIGYWVIGLQNKYEYKVFENSSISSLQIWTPFITTPLCRVGVFLEFEAGTVSFFNVTNHGSLIYKFSNCYFSKATYPFFNLGNCCAPLTVCRPSS